MKQSHLDIAVIDKQIAAEKAAGEIDPVKRVLGMGGPEGGFGDPSRVWQQEQDP